MAEKRLLGNAPRSHRKGRFPLAYTSDMLLAWPAYFYLVEEAALQVRRLVLELSLKTLAKAIQLDTLHVNLLCGEKVFLLGWHELP